MLDKSSNKVVQSGAIACLTKALINCPDEVLFAQLEEITDHMALVLKMKLFQAHQQMLECIISLVFHVQEEFRPYYHKFLGIFMEHVAKQKDPTTKRVAIDAIYSIGAHLANEILDHKKEILALLDKCRTDKSQPVRAAAQETIKLIKDLDATRSQYDDHLDNSYEDLPGFSDDFQHRTMAPAHDSQSANKYKRP